MKATPFPCLHTLPSSDCLGVGGPMHRNSNKPQACDANTEQALLSYDHDVTTKVSVK